MKILNLYACLGGNRYKWGNDHDITSVELDPELCRMYKERFPDDNVINGDAHQYLLDHFQEFDFIWSSPPCPTHSRARYWSSKGGGCKMEYPDMKLYQEIIILEHYFEGKYVVENVIPYYEPMMNPIKRGRHYYWVNFKLPQNLSDRKVMIGAGKNEVEKLEAFHQIDLSTYKGDQRKDKLARNLVDYEAGATILNAALGIIQANTAKQKELF